MSLVSATLCNFRKLKMVGKGKTTAANLTELPLLSHAEILELRFRAQQASQAYTSAREVAQHLVGDARSVFKGSGLDYEESRPYQSGDDPRYINWRLSARSSQPYIKVFREERKAGTFILVDRRTTMRFGTKTRLKVTQAARTAAIAAFNTRLQSSPLSGVILNSELLWIQDSYDDHGAFHFVNTACKACPPDDSMLNKPSLNYILKSIQSLLPQGTTVYLISDFFDLDATSERVLRQMTQQYNVKAIHIVDPAELHLPNAGILMLQLPGKTVVENINTSDALIRSKYESAVNAYMEYRKQVFLSAGISYAQLPTDTANIENIVID